MKIIETIWFNSMGFPCVGIVIIENNVGKRKAYLGIGQGHNEEYDKKMIAENGSPVMPETLESILKKLKGD